MSNKLDRRKFVTASAGIVAGARAALASGRVVGANDRIRMGFIGVRNRGSQIMDAALPNKDVEVVAICDCYEPPLKKWSGKLGSKVDVYHDFRRLIERNDIDAIGIATPDHWHAIQTIDACRSGKDVYVEKPLSITIHEGRRMAEVAAEEKRIVQVGVHRRSAPHFYDLAKLVQGGAIGKVTVARCYRISNMSPTGIGKDPDSDPPPDLDWDMWLGPRAKRPYNKNICPYKFRWWKSYSSQMGNWGVHYFDVIRWMLGEEAPASVSVHGGRWAVDDARTVPDTMEAVFEFASGRLLIFGQYEASNNRMWPVDFRNIDFELRGTLGTVYGGGGGYQIVPETGGQFESPEPRMKPVLRAVEANRDMGRANPIMTAAHMRNFLDCVKSRKRPHADLEVGHRSTTFAHLGNIALATKSRLEWDSRAERITNNPAANKLLHYEYRQPWKLS